KQPPHHWHIPGTFVPLLVQRFTQRRISVSGHQPDFISYLPAITNRKNQTHSSAGCAAWIPDAVPASQLPYYRNDSRAQCMAAGGEVSQTRVLHFRDGL